MQGEASLAKQGDALLEMMHLLATVEIPILAITRGKAAGAGLIMLASADVVIAADNMLWSCPEIEFGMYPTLVHAALSQKLAAARVAQLCVSGLPINAQCALRDGLVTDILASDDFDQASQARLAFYLARPNALRIARASRLIDCDAHALRHYYDRMSHLMHENFNDPTVREAITRYAQALSKSSSEKNQT